MSIEDFIIEQNNCVDFHTWLLYQTLSINTPLELNHDSAIFVLARSRELLAKVERNSKM